MVQKTSLVDSDKARNLIINGGFDFWQRGTSVTTSTTQYLADRFKLEFSGMNNQSISRSTDVPLELADIVPYSMKIDCDFLNLPGFGGAFFISQSIEGNLSKELYGKNLVVSFYAKTNRVGTYGVNITNGLSDSTYIMELVVTNTNWNRYSFVIPHQDSIGTWDTDNSAGMRLQIWLVGGTSYHTSNINAWQEGQVGGASGVTENIENFLDDLSNEFWFTGAMVHEGQEAVDFKRAGDTIEEEESLCERYYERYDGLTAWNGRMAASSTNALGYHKFRTEKRAAPSFARSAAGHFNTSAADGSTGTCTTVTSSDITTKFATINTITNVGHGVHRAVCVFINTTSGWAAWDAEL